MLLHINTTVKNFTITGFPGLLPEYYEPVSVLLFLLYLVIVAGNAIIIVLIAYVKTLHKPAYLIFFHLAMTDIIFGTVTLPKVISRYWWNDAVSSFAACFTQMYFVHAMGATHSLILLLMALDRFVAIWFPFQYPVVITNKSISIACCVCWAVTLIRMVGVVCHALTLSYCNKNTIKQCYCDHVTLANLACNADEVVYVKTVALYMALIGLLLPLSFIVFSYFSIIIAALKISQSENHYKVLATCAPQIFITCLYYIPRCFIYIANNVGFRIKPEARVVVTMMYSLIPPAVNPIIYCLKTKDIKDSLLNFFKKRIVSILVKQ